MGWKGQELALQPLFTCSHCLPGLINDPDIDGFEASRLHRWGPSSMNPSRSFQINKGLRVARKLLCDLNGMGIPIVRLPRKVLYTAVR